VYLRWRRRFALFGGEDRCNPIGPESFHSGGNGAAALPPSYTNLELRLGNEALIVGLAYDTEQPPVQFPSLDRNGWLELGIGLSVPQLLGFDELHLAPVIGHLVPAIQANDVSL